MKDKLRTNLDIKFLYTNILVNTCLNLQKNVLSNQKVRQNDLLTYHQPILFLLIVFIGSLPM